jgi:hypothetical protein
MPLIQQNYNDVMVIYRCSKQFENIRILGVPWFHSYLDLPDHLKLIDFHESLAFDDQVLVFAMKGFGESTARNFLLSIITYSPRLG